MLFYLIEDLKLYSSSKNCLDVDENDIEGICKKCPTGYELNSVDRCCKQTSVSFIGIQKIPIYDDTNEIDI